MYSKKSLSDKELIGMYLKGNESALEHLINRHEKRLFAYIFMVVKDRDLADDIFQDTFVKVINNLRSGNYQEKGKFLQWVMRIAHNLIIDFYRTEKKIPVMRAVGCDNQDILSMIPSNGPTVEEHIITKQIHHDVRSLLDYLPDEQKEVLKMRHFSNMSFKDIAEQTEVSINTALGRMRYALINLRKLVEEHNIYLS